LRWHAKRPSPRLCIGLRLSNGGGSVSDHCSVALMAMCTALALIVAAMVSMSKSIARLQNRCDKEHGEED
jgi:hypothetical protein